MKKIVPITIFVLFIIGCGYSTATDEKEEVQKTIENYFVALSQGEWDKLKEYSTEQMVILDDGLIWNNDSLIQAVEKHWQGYSIKYDFNFIKTCIHQNTAWLYYENNAVAWKDTLTINLSWIESAYLHKIQDKWKIALLHSTVAVKNK